MLLKKGYNVIWIKDLFFLGCNENVVILIFYRELFIWVWSEIKLIIYYVICDKILIVISEVSVIKRW